MSLYKSFKTNKKLEKTEGIWFAIEEAQFKCKRAGGSNDAFTKAVRKYNQKRRAVASGAVSREESDRELAQIYADHVIMDWKGVTDEKDKPLEFTKENVIKLLVDLPDLFDALAIYCSGYDNFLDDEAKAVAKNS